MESGNVSFYQRKSIIIFGIIILMIILGIVIRNSYDNKTSNTKDDIVGIEDREKVFEDLQTIEFKKQDLTNEEKEKYLKAFEKFRDDLRNNLEAVQKNIPNAEAGLYYPLIYLASIHRDIGDYTKAISANLLAHQIQPNAYPPIGNLGDIYFRYLQDYKEAEKWFLQAIEIEGAYTEQYYSELYEIYRFHMKDEKKAESLLISGIQKYPDKLDILATLALHYKQTGKTALAIERYKELLEKNPNSIVAKSALEELE